VTEATKPAAKPNQCFCGSKTCAQGPTKLCPTCKQWWCTTHWPNHSVFLERTLKKQRVAEGIEDPEE
jgi:hypothetical protein